VPSRSTPPLLAVALAAVLLAISVPADPVAPVPPVAHPFLWRVERHGLVSHLFGTVHVGLDPEAALGAAGLAALDRARRVFLEVDVTSADTVAEYMEAALRRAELPPDRSLRQLLPPHAWRRLARLHDGTLAPDELARLEPWFVALWTLPDALAPGERRLPGVRRAAPPLDAAIAARAAARGVAVAPLESPLEHLAGFSAAGRAEGAAMLAEMVADLEAMRGETGRLVTAYARGDERVLRRHVGRLVRRRPTLATYLLFRRNERWCGKLDLWLPEGRVFVAVGLAHMYGERGLPALLRRRGYRVARVPPPGEPPGARSPAEPVRKSLRRSRRVIALARGLSGPRSPARTP
jgi:uncharacterized protein YbaP (TraB family)